ncbi:methyltransferase [Lentzea sp. NBRC 105346]|uniref:class I SAM-dependent methyltransferase n=1 Tax=Lentzea sp. NBRC 105346 TaxID=3032205 RepID=UPI0024A188E9|nr:class I SAM-dependent methyltransferase [Lentzea sp. NBRC 105346]GLZ35733.1 methyltransferase [Lentzea sp. NBRC 105346]
MTDRVRLCELFDAEIASHNERFRAAAAIRSGERVLDFGCGTGESTRQAASIAESVLGLDISPDLLNHARELSTGLSNVTFELGDAQVHGFPAGAFDVAISRFGSMFFTDPVAAFTNVRRALRPGGRLVLLVWQGRAHNEWASVINPDGVESGAFSLGRPVDVVRVLGLAGFGEVAFEDVHEPVYYGPDAETAMDFVTSLQDTKKRLAKRAGAEREQELQRLRSAVANHTTADGVFFDSRAWVITTRRP